MTIRTFVSVTLVLLACNVRAAEPLTIKVVVLLQDKPNQRATPFAEVGGFTMRRSMVDFSSATCPDPSNEKGELVCKVRCEPADANLHLHLFSPRRERARIVAGLTEPTPMPVVIANCKVATKMPVEFVYRTSEVVFGEIQAKAPEVYRAIIAAEKPFSIKPFASTSATLSMLAANDENRQAIREIARLAAAYQDDSPGALAKWRVYAGSPNLADYAVGANSVIFRAAVIEASGLNSSGWVKVSPSMTDFYGSVESVQKELSKKQVLNSKEIKLADDLRQIRGPHALRSEDFVIN